MSNSIDETQTDESRMSVASTASADGSQDLLTEQEVAALLGVSVGTISILRQSGKLGAALEAQLASPVTPDHIIHPSLNSSSSIPAKDIHRLRYLNDGIEESERISKLESLAFRLEKVCETLDPYSGRDGDSLFISEKQAAAMAGISPKTLGDRRRAGRVPRRLYRQDCRNGKVRYNADRWREYLSS